jgi:hypothetical protein
MEDYNSARARENEAVVENAGEETRSCVSDANESDDGYLSDDLEEAFENDSSVGNHDILWMIGAEVLGDDHTLRVFPTPRVAPQRIESILDDFEKHHLVQDIAQDVAANTVQAACESMNVEALKNGFDRSRLIPQ